MRRFLPVLLLALALSGMAAPVRQTLPNGLRLLTVPSATSPVVSIEMLIDCSAFDEPWQLLGIRQVLLTSMLQGSAITDGTAIRRSMAAVGGIIEGRVQQDTLEISVTVPADSLALGLNALAEIVCRPQLSDAGIQAAVLETEREAAMPPSGSMETASWAMNDALYADHPYARRGHASAETLAQLSPQLLRFAYQYFIRPDYTVMSVVGRCDQAKVNSLSTALFSEWPQGKAREPQASGASRTLEASRLVLREAPVQSTCVMMSFPVCGATQQDFLTLRVIDALLGGGTGSRLFRTIREQQHLAYEVATQLPMLVHESTFSLYAITHSRYVDDTKAALVAEISKLQVEAISSGELARAKAYLKGRHLLGHQSSAQYAYDLAWDEMMGLGADYDEHLAKKIDAVTADDVQRIARKYFTHYYLTVVVPLSVVPSAQ
ncbi:MAG TPA: pitrilysin family protein [Armatimonadota bacterium]